MWAQRFTGQAQQEVLHFKSTSADELASHISHHVQRFHVRIVGVSAYIEDGGTIHHALVTFEPEPIEGS